MSLKRFDLSKRTKKKILELCGFTSLNREEKARLASQILFDNDEKQRICNQINGISHKDVELALKDMVDEKLLEESFEKESFPEKFGLSKPRRETIPIKVEMVELLDREEVRRLVEATNAPVVQDEVDSKGIVTSTYDEWEANMLVNGVKTKRPKRKK